MAKLHDPWQGLDPTAPTTVRVQSDIPLQSKAFIQGLFGKRGALQEIINTTLNLVELECRRLGYICYDPTIDPRDLVGAILSRIYNPTNGPTTAEHTIELDRAASGAAYSASYTTTGDALARAVEAGANSGAQSSHSGQSSVALTEHPTPRNPVGGGDAGDDHGSTTDEDRTPNDEGSTNKRGRRAASQSTKAAGRSKKGAS